MELVYLWVEDYKNIKKQGFNFSPNFECEFFPIYEKYRDENGEEKEKLKDNCELKITPKENPLKDFFGKDINVTAIVGENGVGKSNLIELLTTDNSNICHFIVIKTDTLYLINNTKRKIETDIMDYTSNKHFFNLNFDYLKFTPDDTHFYNMLTSAVNNNIDKEISQGTIINKHKHNKEINRLVYKYQNIFNKFFNRNVVKLEIKQNNLSNKYNLEKAIPSDYKDKVSSNYISKILYTLEKNNDLKAKEKLKKDYEDLVNDNDGVIKYLDKNSTVDITNLDENFISFLLLSEIQDYLELKLYDEKNICIFDFSQGERQLLQQFIKIQNLLENNKDVCMCLDEPTNTFHPNWQKEYINKLVSVFKNSFTHFIITSHSPFILSDLPKQNVIFLEKDKDAGNCINATDKVDINSFGANIHTLLSHGFFMKKGLMGEFAKSKIDEVIKYLNTNQKSTIPNDKEAQNIINIIGEPIIKRELQRMLKNKTELESHENVAKIQDEIEVLKKRIEELEKEKHNVSQ